MRRQTRRNETPASLSAGDAKVLEKEAKRATWSIRWTFALLVAASTRWKERRRLLLPICSIVALLFLINGVLFPYLYGSWIRKHPEWLFPHGSDDESRRSVVGIFYHIFVPPNKGKKGIQQARDIIREQLLEIARHESIDKFHVYYTTTGVASVAKRHTDTVCSELDLHCQWMGHWEEGQEVLTLSRLHTFCHLNPGSTVLYIHTKGSFHTNKGRNHAWRWHLTRAALSCCTSLNSTSCNVCGLQFYPVWTTFFPGNMWTASCDYISMLLPPEQFTLELESAVTNAKNSDQFVWSLFNASNPSIVGLGRYAMEHWVGSHPSLQPCDIVSSSPRIEQWYDMRTTQSRFVTSAPQFDWKNDAWFRWNLSAVERILPSTQWKKEYFLLPGFLYKWQRLYKGSPPKGSWAWKWYPQGQK